MIKIKLVCVNLDGTTYRDELVVQNYKNLPDKIELHLLDGTVYAICKSRLRSVFAEPIGCATCDQ